MLFIVMQSIAPNPTRLPEIIDPPRAVCQRTNLSSTTIWRMRRAGQFPEPIQLSPGRVGWRRSDIDAWLETRAVGGRWPVTSDLRRTIEDVVERGRASLLRGARDDEARDLIHRAADWLIERARELRRAGAA